MILDQMDDHMGGGSQMMGWAPYMWFYMVLGILIFLIFVLILIYLLNRGSFQVEDSTPQETKLNQKSKNQNRNRVISKETAAFCPSCGVQLKNRTLKYCSYCGTKV